METYAQELLCATRQDAITFSSCTETPSWRTPAAPCCPAGGDRVDVHPRIYNGCPKNSSPNFQLHTLDLKEKTERGHSLCHYFGLKPVQADYKEALHSFAFHHQDKLPRPTDQSTICQDIEFGILLEHSSVQRTMKKSQYYNLSQRSFPYSELSPRFGDTMTYRQGAQRLNPSQEYSLCSWIQSLLSRDPPILLIDLEDNPPPVPCFHPSFVYYTDQE